MPGDPLTLCRRLEQNARAGPFAEDGGEPLAAGHDPALDQLPVLGDGAELALAYVEINAYAIHGWPPGWFAALTAWMLVGHTLPPRCRGGPAASYQLS
jgi:hypothetical protein